MNLTERDKWLCAALPALLTLAVYGWFFARPVLRENAVLRFELRGQEPPEVRDERLAIAREEGVRLAEELAELRAETDGMESPAVAGASPVAAARNRAGVLRMLSDLCGPSGARLVSARRQERGGAGGGDGVGGLLERMKWTAAQPWRLELRGTYGGMARWLEGLSELGVQALPTGLEMEPGTEAAQPASWVLDMWI